MSDICEAFHCSPLEALRQPWEIIVAIMEYRAAKFGIEMLNDHKRGYDALVKHPEIADLLVELGRVQGAYADSDQMQRYFKTEAPAKPAEPESDMTKFKSMTGA